MRKLFIVMIVLVVLMTIAGCAGNPPAPEGYDMPEEGSWYCAELETCLVLDWENGSRKPSYIIIDGKQVSCSCSIPFNTTYIILRCQESGVDGFDNGDSIYWWTLIEYSDTEMLLQDYETGQQYSFLRVESQ